MVQRPVLTSNMSTTGTITTMSCPDNSPDRPGMSASVNVWPSDIVLHDIHDREAQEHTTMPLTDRATSVVSPRFRLVRQPCARPPPGKPGSGPRSKARETHELKCPASAQLQAP